MEKTDLAYLAGLFDGDGCIRISRERTGLVLRTDFSMTNEYLPALFRFSFGGILRQRKRDNNRWANIWHWGTCANRAAVFLKAISPYLILKKPQCQIALCFQNGRWNNNFPLPSQYRFQRLTSQEAAFQEAQYLAIKSLNKRGRHKETLIKETKTTTRKTDLAYMAGFFDAEGTITIRDNRWNIIAQFVLTDPSIPHWFKFNFGGSIYHYTPSNGKRSEFWRWQVSSQKALCFIHSVYPYLILKKSRADVAIEFQALLRKKPLGYKPLTDEERAVREAQLILIRNLNRKGVK